MIARNARLANDLFGRVHDGGVGDPTDQTTTNQRVLSS
jgi:hypothetical protein